MIHLRMRGAELNKDAKYHCGLTFPLPEGDKAVYADERGSHHLIDCPGCKPFAARLGTPINELTQARFEEIGRSWGYP
ncbi:MAG: hypothetical protein ACPGFA_01145 [Pikeienuella sp.]